jgi:hypothetical protein
MPGLVPGIHVFRAAAKAWMAGTSPAMTEQVHLCRRKPHLTGVKPGRKRRLIAESFFCNRFSEKTVFFVQGVAIAQLFSGATPKISANRLA